MKIIKNHVFFSMYEISYTRFILRFTDEATLKSIKRIKLTINKSSLFLHLFFYLMRAFASDLDRVRVQSEYKS